MKKYLFTSVVVLLFSLHFNTSFAQMSLIGAIPKDFYATESQIVDLSISGKKIMTMNAGGSILTATADTIFFYNMDLSFWKMIVLPYLPGYKNQYHCANTSYLDPNVLYPSEKLFNLDPMLEVAILCVPSIGAVGKYYILNETGALTDSVLNVNAASGFTFHVFEDTPGVFKLTVLTTNGLELYRLPGTIPCGGCTSTGTPGIVSTVKPAKNVIETTPIPNPSADQLKITFSLPDGVNMGKLSLYSSTGQLVKSYQVDNRFGYILVDNRELPSGVYFYNIEVNGNVSSTQKILVLR